MRTKKAAICLCAYLLISLSSYGNEPRLGYYKSAQKIFEICSDVMPEKYDGKISCYHYLWGYIDAHTWYESSNKYLCIPEEIGAEEMRIEFLAWGNNNKERLKSLPAANALVMSLNRRWDCDDLSQKN